MATRYAARHLRNHKLSQFELIVAVRISHQRLGDLFRRRNCRIRCDAPVHRPRIVEIEQSARKIGAVIREKIEVTPVLPCVKVSDQTIVLFSRRDNFEAVNLSDVRHSQQLRPYALAIRFTGIRSQSSQMGLGIFFPHRGNCGLFRPLRYILLSLHSVEIWQKRNGNPVELPNA